MYHAWVLAAAFFLGTLTLVPPQPAWLEIRLEARKLFLKATATITVERCPAAAVTADLRTPPLGEGVAPETGMVDVVRVNARLPFGRTERIAVWLDAATGAVLQNEKRRYGKDAYWKVRRATDDGYYEWRTEPDLPGETRNPPPAWSDRFERRVVFDPVPPEGTVVTDPYGLVAALPALLRSGRSTAIVSGDRAVPVTIRTLEPRTVSRTARLRWPGGEGTVRRFTARPVQVRVNPGADVDRRRVRTGVLGLRGDLEILVADETGLPVLIRGRAPSVGKVTVHLAGAALRLPPERRER